MNAIPNTEWIQMRWLARRALADMPAMPDRDLAEHAHQTMMMAACCLGMVDAGKQALAEGAPADVVDAELGQARELLPQLLETSKALREECESRAETRIADLMDECAAQKTTLDAALESLRATVRGSAYEKGMLSDREQDEMDRAHELVTASLRMTANYLLHAGPDKSTDGIRSLCGRIIESTNLARETLTAQDVNRHTQDVIRRLGDEARRLMAATAGWELVN